MKNSALVRVVAILADGGKTLHLLRGKAFPPQQPARAVRPSFTIGVRELPQNQAFRILQPDREIIRSEHEYDEQQLENVYLASANERGQMTGHHETLQRDPGKADKDGRTGIKPIRGE